MKQMSIRKEAAILTLAAAFLGGYLFSFALPRLDEADAPAGAKPSQINGPPIRRYAEALLHIERDAMFSPPVGNPQEIIASSLKAYLGQKDPY